MFLLTRDIYKYQFFNTKTFMEFKEIFQRNLIAELSKFG
uniref:Uncharacterized protein n=1 Tax=Bacillus subtilis subsp. natto TaxID=86029 RepID=E9RJ80_BACNA|nr:hypothetical protein [Bacillus subtilis subsp. natto]